MQLTRYPVARAPIVIGAMVGTFAVATGLGVAYLSAPAVDEVPIEAAPAPAAYPAPTVAPPLNTETASAASLAEKRKSTKRRARNRKPKRRKAVRRSPRRSVTAVVAPAVPTAVATPTATARPVATAAPVRRRPAPKPKPKPKPKATPAPTFDSSG